MKYINWPLALVIVVLSILSYAAILEISLSMSSNRENSLAVEIMDIAGAVSKFTTVPGDSSFVGTNAFAKTLSIVMPSRFVRSNGSLRTYSGSSVSVTNLPHGRYLIIFDNLSRSDCRLILQNVGRPLTVDALFNARGIFQAPCAPGQPLALEAAVPGAPALPY